MKRSHQAFWVLVAAQLVFLLGWAGYHEGVRQHAPVILLKGRPVDPRDLLRGDYLTLNYDISDVTLSDEAGDPHRGRAAGSEVWVLLEQQDRYFVVAQASRERLHPGAGQVLVRGTMGRDWRSGGRPGGIRYGIERYFVPEGQGSPRFERLEVEVSVSPAHRLFIRRVLLDGQAFP